MGAENSKIKAVILDLDQTLTTDTGSWIQFTKLTGADPDIHTEIYIKFKNGELDYQTAKRDLINLWKKTGKTNKKDIEKIFRQIELRNGAVDAINYLKSKYKVCIISGAIDVFVGVFADKLGIEHYYASTKFLFDGKGELTDFQYTLGRGEEKLGYFNEFCNKFDIDPRQCAAIGDGESDMPIFEKVGLPVLFIASETASEQIEKIETKIRNWKEIYNIL